jgi:hypothetical protein
MNYKGTATMKQLTGQLSKVGITSWWDRPLREITSKLVSREEERWRLTN